MEPDFNTRAGKLIAEGRLAEARTVLDAAIQEMPKGWTPIREEADSVTISFWAATASMTAAGNWFSGASR